MRLSLIVLIILFSSCNNEKEWLTIKTEEQCVARHECGFVAHNNNLYLIGGRGIKPVDMYNTETKNWIHLENTPIEMNHITPVSINGNIYIASGFTGNYPKETPLSHVYTYNTESKKWTTVFEIPENRRRGGAGVSVYNNKIYIVNGIIDGHTSGTSSLFDVYDPEKNTWTVLENAPNIRDHSAAVVINDVLISLGGRNTSYHEENNFEAFFSTVIDKVDYYNFTTKKWDTYQEKIPNPAAGGGAVVLNNNVFYIGGETGNKIANNLVYSFNANSQKWKKEPSLNTGRHGTNAVVNKGEIYIASGSGNQGGGPELNSIEVYLNK